MSLVKARWRRQCTHRSRAVFLPSVAVSTLLAVSVHAADIAWVGKVDGSTSNAENWANASLPTAQDILVFGAASHTDLTLDADLPAAGITFNDSAPPYTIAGHTLNLASGAAIRKAAASASQLQTIASDLKLGDTATFSCDDKRFDNFANRLVLKGHLQGNGAVTIDGPDAVCGGVDLAADNHDSFTGSITLNNGLLLLSASSGALGSGTAPVVLHAGGFMCFGGVHTDNAFDITGAVDWESSGENAHGGNIAVDNGASWTVGNGGGNALTLSGVISGDGAIRFNCGNTTLSGSGANTFSQPLIFSSDSSTEVYNELRLDKTGGAVAIPGPLEIHKKANVIWQGDDQVAASAAITMDGGKFSLGGHNNTLGALTLTDGAEIDLAGGTLHFADSSASAWEPKGQLVIHGWARGNGSDIVFGNSDKALTPEQLSKIGFDSPDGKAAGIYKAKIAHDGELTPTDAAAAPVNPPFDLSPAADADRKKLYSVDGLAELTGPRTPLKAHTTISIFGDSITWLNTYITLIRSSLAASPSTHNLQVSIINHGINGGGVLQVLDGAPKAAFDGKGNDAPQDGFAKVMAADKANIAVVYIGVNDVWWRKTTPEDFTRGMTGLVTAAKRANVTLVLVTMATIGERPDGSNPDDAKLDQYSALTRDVAKATGTTLVDLRKDYIAYLRNHNRQMHVDGTLAFKPNGLLTNDGVHPSAAGAEMLAQLISDGIYRALHGSDHLTTSN